MKGFHVDGANKDVASYTVNDAERIVSAKQAGGRKWELRCQLRGREHGPCSYNLQQRVRRPRPSVSKDPVSKTVHDMKRKYGLRYYWAPLCTEPLRIGVRQQ